MSSKDHQCYRLLEPGIHLQGVPNAVFLQKSLRTFDPTNLWSKIFLGVYFYYLPLKTMDMDLIKLADCRLVCGWNYSIKLNQMTIYWDK